MFKIMSKIKNRTNKTGFNTDNIKKKVQVDF